MSSRTGDESESGRAFPAAGRIAGIDYGTVRIGIAVTDAERRIASPLENYSRRSEKLDDEYLLRLLREERIVGLVVGLPVHASGDDSASSVAARRFGDRLAALAGLPVAYYDERYTSALAEQYLQGAGLTSKQRKARMDKLAAQILLASWLESSGTDRPPGSLD